MSASANSTTAVPRAVTWYQRYCQAVMALFISASFGGAFAALSRDALAERLALTAEAVIIFGGLWALTCLFLAFVHFAALRTPRSPWAWKIHAVVLAMGLTTLVLWPVALPLIWAWMKPEVKRFYGVDAPSAAPSETA